MSTNPVEREAPGQPLRWRVLTSLLLTLSFLAMAWSGLALFLTPSGRLARANSWSWATLDRDQWIALHLNATMVFAMASVIHLAYNWRCLLGYLRSRAVTRPGHWRELLLASGLVLVVVAGTIANVQPFSSLAALRGRIKGCRFSSSSSPAPATLAVPPEAPADGLRRGPAPPASAAPAASVDTGRHTGGQTSARAGHGHGYGQMSLSELCQTINVPLDRALVTLRGRGVQATGASRVRDLGEQLGGRPHDVADLLSAPVADR